MAIGQIVRWLARPIAFLEACRRGYGDAFSVRFLGFRVPSSPYVATCDLLVQTPAGTLLWDSNGYLDDALVGQGKQLLKARSGELAARKLDRQEIDRP